MTRRVLLLSAGLLGVAASPLAAQSPHDLVSRGITAYRALEYDQAATLLRRGLLVAGRGGLPDSARAESLIYLGATQLFRGRRDSAAHAFRLALAADPRSRADTLIFPPEVSNAFAAARRGSAFVRIRVPAETTLAPDGQYQVRLYASAPHDALVEIAGADGSDPRRLYLGSLADSLDLKWDGRDADGRVPRTGSLVLQVASRPDGGSPRVTRIPLTVRAVSADTLVPPAPPPPPLKDSAGAAAPPGGAGSGSAVGSLAAGLLSGLAVVLLPKVIASDGDGGSARFVIGGTLGVAGVLGFAVRRATPPAVAAHRAALASWRRAVESVQRENERRRREASIRITSGEQDAPEPERGLL